MIKRSFGTRSDFGIARRLERRLNETMPDAFGIETRSQDAFTFCDVTVRFADKKAFDCLSKSLQSLLIKDWLPVQLLECIDTRYDALPEGARMKVLLDSIRHARSLNIYNDLAKQIHAFLARSDTLLLEGFVRFRLKEAYAYWVSCVEHAAEEWLLEYETGEFLKLLRSFADVQQPRTGEVTVSSTPAGGYQLMDEFGRKIEDDAFKISGAIAQEDALVSLLVSVAPSRIWIYGLKREAKDAIVNVFGNRARFLPD